MVNHGMFVGSFVELVCVKDVVELVCVKDVVVSSGHGLRPRKDVEVKKKKIK